MAGMYKKVNGRENVLGWFGVKKKPDSIDLEINKIFLGFTLRPIFIIFWTQKDVSGFFLEAFSEAKKATRRGNHFQTLPTGVGMLESEEIGVFQILRNSDWSESKKTSQIYKLWIQILFSLSRFLKKKFLKSSFNSAHSEIPFSLFLNIKVQVKKFSSIFLEKNFFRENLFFLYSSALLKTMVSIERFVNLAMKKGIKKN